MEVLREEITLSQWGNSKALRLPIALVNMLGYTANDKLQLNVEVTNTGAKRLVIDRVQPETQCPQVPQSIADLFKDYTGGSFQADVQEFEAAGNELW
ncbi:MAG: hypothetical protein FWH20_07205 [Oscillospiraceae bacterium]|nr:hypothetical protein [Oscillospiraceae bacterium]